MFHGVHGVTGFGGEGVFHGKVRGGGGEFRRKGRGGGGGFHGRFGVVLGS